MLPTNIALWHNLIAGESLNFGLILTMPEIFCKWKETAPPKATDYKAIKLCAVWYSSECLLWASEEKITKKYNPKRIPWFPAVSLVKIKLLLSSKQQAQHFEHSARVGKLHGYAKGKQKEYFGLTEKMNWNKECKQGAHTAWYTNTHARTEQTFDRKRKIRNDPLGTPLESVADVVQLRKLVEHLKEKLKNEHRELKWMQNWEPRNFARVCSRIGGLCRKILTLDWLSSNGAKQMPFRGKRNKQIRRDQ